MEQAVPGKDTALLARMRSLARRGALLSREADGAGLIQQADERREAQRIAPQEFLELLDAGWLKASGADRFVISRRGASALRNMLNRPAAARNDAPRAPAGLPSTASGGRALPGLNARESPLAWLRQRRDKDGRPMISAVELEAGERLRVDFERGQMSPRVTASWNAAAVSSGGARSAPGIGVELSDTALGARQRVELALKAVGPELSGVLLDVCCFLQGLEQAERNGGWPRRAGKVVLQLALAHLARHYGLHQGAAAANGKVRSWGAPDHRPQMDAPGTGDGD